MEGGERLQNWRLDEEEWEHQVFPHFLYNFSFLCDFIFIFSLATLVCTIHQDRNLQKARSLKLVTFFKFGSIRLDKTRSKLDLSDHRLYFRLSSA